MATRAQTVTQVTWSAASTKSIAIGGAMNYSDDFTFSGDLIDKEITVTAKSAGTASDDIVEIHMGVKKDPDRSNSGTPDSYDSDDYTYVGSLDCSSGNDTQRTFTIGCMAGDIVRFGALNNGTNAIVVGIEVSQDTLAY